MIDIATRLLELAPRVESIAPRDRPSPLTYVGLPEAGKWAEVRIVAPTLRLAGRLDMVEKGGGRVTIRDLKSGRVEDRDGQILAHIELQLRLYGTMARELSQDVPVRLVVDSGNEREVPFDDAIHDDMRSWVLDRVGQLPPKALVRAGELAQLGNWCGQCSHRHVCTTYLRAAPAGWRDVSTERLPQDVWGRIIELREGSSETFDLTIMDAAERHVRIFGVGKSRVAGARPNDRIWLFGLRGRTVRAPAGGWRHPVNFYEMSVDDRRERAWSLEVFGPSREGVQGSGR